jgi:hypothetical protein
MPESGLARCWNLVWRVACMVDLQGVCKFHASGPVLLMSLFSRSIQLSVLSLLWLLSGVLAARPASAQVSRFNVPAVIPSGNWPASVAAGDVDNTGKPSVLSCDSYSTGVTLACHLYQLVNGAWTATQSYPLVGATAARAIAVDDPVLGLYGVAILSVKVASPATSSTFTVQFYPNGTGNPLSSTASTLGGAVPVLADFAYRPSLRAPPEPGMFIATDSANGYFYILEVASAGGSLNPLSPMMSSIVGPDPTLCGAILPNLYPTSGTHGSRPAFAVVSTNGTSAGTVVMNPDGTWAPLNPAAGYTGSGSVYSALLADMDGDGIADLVTEGSSGRIDIYRGLSDGTFARASEGGSGTLDGITGNGGRLVAVDPNTRNILTATPIGLSVLQPQSSGSLTYVLKGIYNIGPGRASYALADVNGDGHSDLAVDSPEGVAIVLGDANGDGGFQTARAYPTLAPALSAVVGKFRNSANNPTGNLDVVVATGALQGQLLEGNGNGGFGTFPGVMNSSSGQNIPANVWSSNVSGDFNGDGIPDIAYSLIGLPTPTAGLNIPALYVQYGNGDGSFQAPLAVTSLSAGAPNNNSFYGGSAAGDFNGDNIGDIASSDLTYADTLLGQRSNGPFKLELNSPLSFATNFEQVATGYFTAGRTSQQDVVFQRGANLFPFKNHQDGTGNFTLMSALYGENVQYATSALLLADIDGDGFGDVIALYYNFYPAFANGGAAYRMFIYFGNGDGTFSSSPVLYPLSRNYTLAAVADMNGDGLPDLVLSDGSLISILYNQGNRSFGTLLPSGLYSSEQHFLAGQGINSISLVDVNGDGVPDLVAANGGLAVSNPLVVGGPTASPISLAANPPDINTGGITVLINHIAPQPVTGTLAASPEPTVFGQAFTMTATLTPGPGVALPTGTVQFYLDGATLVGTGQLAPTQGSTTTSSASFTVPQGNTFAGGMHPMTAVYSGDSANSQATIAGTVGTHQVQNIGTTSYIVMCIGPTVLCPAPPGVPSPAPVYTPALTMYYGQIWNGFLGESANDGSALTGNVELIDTYTGADVPPPLPLCVLPVTGGACPNSVGTTQGTSVGLNVLTAYYPGDATHTASTSPPIAITVVPDLTSAMLTGSPNPSPALLPVTFTATVTGNYAAPTGPVAFFFGNTLLGQVNLVPSASGNTSTATLTTSILPVGNDLITMTYGATMNFAAAGASFTETITPSISGNFTISVTPASASVGVGYSTLLVVKVTPLNGFSQGVNLSCANLPSEATCFFDIANLTAGNYTTDLVIGTTAPHSCGASTPYFLGSNGGGPGVAPFALPAIAGLLAIFLPGRRRWMRSLLAVILVAGMTHLTGCGNCTDLGTRPATYTFQVTGAATGTSEVESQPVTITVKI